MIGDILDVRSLVVVREDHGITLRREPPDLRRPFPADLAVAGHGAGHQLLLFPMKFSPHSLKTPHNTVSCRRASTSPAGGRRRGRQPRSAIPSRGARGGPPGPRRQSGCPALAAGRAAVRGTLVVA